MKIICINAKGTECNEIPLIEGNIYDGKLVPWGSQIRWDITGHRMSCYFVERFKRYYISLPKNIKTI